MSFVVGLCIGIAVTAIIFFLIAIWWLDQTNPFKHL